MPKTGAGGTDREIRMFSEEAAFLRGDGLDTGGAGDDRAARLDCAKLRPELLQRVCDVAGLLAPAVVADHPGQPRKGFGAARQRMLPGFDHQEGAGRAEREARMLLPRPDRNELVAEIV